MSKLSKLTWEQAAAWRVRRQFLSRRTPAKNFIAVASRLCGLHAQVLSSSLLTLWARVDNLKPDTLERALWRDKSLVKTWAMRGTLHLLPANEFSLWRAAFHGHSRYRSELGWERYLGISLKELDEFTEHIGAALLNNVFTREELGAEIGRRMQAKTLASAVMQSSWGTVFKPAAFRGTLCFAPSLGQRVRFTNPETWLGTELEAMGSREAETEIARRFLSAYAPATMHDLGRWWGGGVSKARQWIAWLGDEVEQVDLEGTKAWMLSRDLRSARDFEPTRTVNLLPGFDQYVIAASRHAENLMPDVPRALIYRPQGWVSPVLLVNGFMHGVWRHELKGDRLEVAIQPFLKSPMWVRRAAAEEGERLARFFGAKLKLTWQ